jgi:hypothetical protein
MTAPAVVLHRPPLKRVDFGLKPRQIEPETASEATRALREIGARIEQERLWRLVRQSAEGCNPGRVE